MIRIGPQHLIIRDYSTLYRFTERRWRGWLNATIAGKHMSLADSDYGAQRIGHILDDVDEFVDQEDYELALTSMPITPGSYGSRIIAQERVILTDCGMLFHTRKQAYRTWLRRCIRNERPDLPGHCFGTIAWNVTGCTDKEDWMEARDALNNKTA